MSSINLGINGFNKLSKTILDACLLDPVIIVRTINDPFFSLDFMCYFLRHETTSIKSVAAVEGNYLLINDTQKIRVTNAHECTSMGWREENVDIVVECSRAYTTRDRCWAHLVVGVPTVVIATQSVDAALVHVILHNDTLLNKLPVVCTGDFIGTAIAPLIDILSKYTNVDEIIYTAVHGSLTTDPTAGRSSAFEDWCEARQANAAVHSITPYAHKGDDTLKKIFPHFQGRINGKAYHVPTQHGCVVDLYAHTADGFIQNKSDLNSILLNAIKEDEYRDFIDSSSPNEILLGVDCMGRDKIIYEQESVDCILASNSYRLRLWMDLECCYTKHLTNAIKRIAKASDKILNRSI